MMTQDSEPPPSDAPLYALSLLVLISSWSIASAIFLLIVLLVCSALISGSEVAFFSLTPQELEDLKNEKTKQNQRILYLRSIPRRLLATILITNNFVNIAIVILSDYIVHNVVSEAIFLGWGEQLHRLPLLDQIASPAIARGVSFLLTVFSVTFLLVLFGEVAPKIYAKLNNIRLSRWMAGPLKFMVWLFTPLSSLMVKWAVGLERRLRAGGSGAMTQAAKDDIDKAIDLAVSQDADSKIEADILKGIIKFNDVSVKQVMRARVDVEAVDREMGFKELLKIVRSSGYSRIPVYEASFDNIVGILYVKDLIGHAGSDNRFHWQELIRDQVLYVPESKKINELLKAFQEQRVHMAIVVDEYGGSAGLVTLEDVMEEVIGEIKDEFDEEREGDIKKIGPRTFIFDGKVLINEGCRALGIDTNMLESVRGDADSIAGLLLEKSGGMPIKGQEFSIEGIKFIVLSVSQTRIEKIRVSLPDET